MLVRENLQWTKNCPLGFRHVDASTEPEGGYYSLCHQCLNATYGDTAAAVLMQWLNSEAQLTFDSECGSECPILAPSWILKFHEGKSCGRLGKTGKRRSAFINTNSPQSNNC
jgi:hypothetical protein